MTRPSTWVCALACVAVVGCSTPYKPPVTIRGSAEFDGLLALAAHQQGRPLDIVMAHGMCTHHADWAARSVNAMMQALGSSQARLPEHQPDAPTVPGTDIQLVRADVEGGGQRFRISALVWSTLTSKLKQRLDYDRTGDRPTDCAKDPVCKPQRARVNAKVKDTLVNDCFADALIYQGAGKDEIRRQVKIALMHATDPGDFKARLAMQPEEALVAATRASAAAVGSLAVISDSLGSKVFFDALHELSANKAAGLANLAAERTRQRIGLVFMRANQLPLLSLADSDRNGTDPIRSLSQTPREVLGAPGFRRTVVAFSDPNDLLSYPLTGSSYQGPDWKDLKIADVLVSNARTWFGLIEHPWAAHTDYDINPDVTRLMLQGSPGRPPPARALP